MDHELRISTEAERCIEEQLQWYEVDEANGGAELADRWLDLLTAALEALGRHPERNGFAPENGRWMPEVAIRSGSCASNRGRDRRLGEFSTRSMRPPGG